MTWLKNLKIRRSAPNFQSWITPHGRVRSYLDIPTGTFVVRQLQPWHENIGKRQVKAPKIYLRDSGLLHGLLGLPDGHSEFKFSEAPKVAKSQHTAVGSLNLDHRWIVYPGPQAYAVDDQITVWPLQELAGLPGQMG